MVYVKSEIIQLTNTKTIKLIIIKITATEEAFSIKGYIIKSYTNMTIQLSKMLLNKY